MLQSKALWWSLLIVWIAASTYWHVCKVLKLCDAELSITVAETSLPAVGADEQPLLISDAPLLRLRSKGNFSFAKGGIIANKSEVYPQLDSLALYLMANPGKLLTITGFYSSDEVNTTIFSNLGLARANDVKHWLVRKGLSGPAFSIKSSQKNDMAFSKDSLHGGIHFSFSEIVPPELVILAEQQRYTGIFKPLDLFFPEKSTEYVSTRYNQEFIKAAKKYLAENTNEKLLINAYPGGLQGTLSDHSLSEKRVDFLKKRLIASGILADRIASENVKPELKIKKDSVLAKYVNEIVTILVK